MPVAARRRPGSYQYRLPDRNVATERLIKHLGLYEKDNRQGSANPFTEIVAHIAANGKTILDFARERERRDYP